MRMDIIGDFGKLCLCHLAVFLYETPNIVFTHLSMLSIVHSEELVVIRVQTGTGMKYAHVFIQMGHKQLS